MDMFDSMGSLGSFDLASVFKMNDYSRQTQDHLYRVYLSLLLCVLAASCGAAVAMFYRLSGDLSFLGMMGGMGMLMWINFDSKKEKVQRRMALLCAFGFFEGLSVGPLLYAAAFIDPALIVTAFLGTVAVFACFTASAVISKRRSYLYLGGMLGSAVTLMLVLSLANMFFRSVNIFLVELYGGLLIFSGYVVFDTQLILEKAEYGSKDVVGHAVTLFIDFVGIFVRILIILIRNNSGRSNNRNKSRRDRGRSEF
jgi:FtsH-binding integral membrane protein